MDDLIRLDEFGEFYYRTNGEPITKSQRLSLNWMCREGCLRKFAIKIGNKWFLKKEVLNGTE